MPFWSKMLIFGSKYIFPFYGCLVIITWLSDFSNLFWSNQMHRLPKIIITSFENTKESMEA
jgi:hypothetical protein